MKKIESHVILILLHIIAFSGTSNQPKNGFKMKVETNNNGTSKTQNGFSGNR